MVLHRAPTQVFQCCRCLGFTSKFPGKMQAHCRGCGGADSSTPNRRSSPHRRHRHHHHRRPDLGVRGSQTAQPVVEAGDDDGDQGPYIASQLHFFVNEDLHLAICRPCGYVVEAASIHQHARRVHAVCVDGRRLAMDVDRFQLESGAAAIATYKVATVDLKDPIEGLEVVDGLGCSGCPFYCRSESSLKAHLRTAHPSSRGTHGGGGPGFGETHRRCCVQRLAPSPGNNSWFGVKPPAAAATLVDPLADIITREAEQRREEAVQGAYADARHPPLFLKRLGWEETMREMGDDLAEVARRVAAPGPADEQCVPVEGLRGVLTSLMSDFQRNNGSAEALLRRKVKSTKPGDLSAAPFSRLDHSSDQYVGTLVHLVVVLLRFLDDGGSEHVGSSGFCGGGGGDDVRPVLVPLGLGLRQSLRGLRDELRRMEDEEDPANRAAPPEGSGWHNSTASGPTTASSKSLCIDILEHLFFIHRASHAVPQASLLVYRFVVFVAVQQDRVIQPDEITHRISRMMYWCRSLVLHKIIHAPASDTGAADGIDGAEDHYLRFVHDGLRTPFAAILEVKRLVFTITRNEIPLPRVVWVGGDGQVVDGIVVDIRGLSEMIRKAIAELREELERDVLLSMPAFHSNRDRLLQSKSAAGLGLQDNLRDQRSGQCFVRNQNNHCSDYTLALVHHIAADADLRRRFVVGVGAGSAAGGVGCIDWNLQELRKWLLTSGMWLRKLLAVAHLLAGQPARGVEFLSCSIRNTPALIRGVYVVDGLAMLLSVYGKADNLRGTQRPVARFLCRDTTFLLINYLTYVREMEVVASRVLFGVGSDEGALYDRLLAVENGRAITSRDLSEDMARLFLNHFRVSVTLNPWRHMAIAWMHRFLKYGLARDVDHPDGSGWNGPLDSQAGHSQQAASRLYGRSNFDHPSIGRDEFQLYRLASVEWHRLLHLDSDRLPATWPSPPQNSPAAGSTPPAVNVHHHHHHAIKVVRSVGDVHKTDDIPSLACSDSALRGLLELGHTKFKSPHQAQAIHRILDRQEDLLVVLPTGGGKTLLFLLPALVESGRRTTVVVCPFVALRKEMLRSLEENARISVQVYSDGAAPGAVDILLVSVELCLSDALQNHLGQLHAEGRLARIVVDECHLALVASSWRPAVHQLQHVRRVPVPLLLLSATVPPKMEGPLRQFFCSQLCVIRSPTTRPNIAHRVMKHRGPVDATLLGLLPPRSLGAGWVPQPGVRDTTTTTPKSIVFARGREETGILAALLCAAGRHAVHYHGHLDEGTKAAAQDSWMNGEADVMVATGAFGAGVHLAAVRLVVHVDEPYSMIDLAQESGRGGRDGLPTTHIVLLPMSWQPRPGGCDMLARFLGGSTCRRLVLQEYVDGSGLDCFSSGSEPCDVCHSMAAAHHAVQPPTTCLGFGGPDPAPATPRTAGSSAFGTGASTPSAAASTPAAAAGEGSDDDDDVDLFAGMDEETLALLERRPIHRVCLSDALLFGSTRDAQERHAAHALTLLNLVQFLQGAKDKCILCVMNQPHGHNGPAGHSISGCPYSQHRCFKCLGRGHGAAACPSRLHWRGGQCFSCGLPNSLGQQVMHPERYGPGCGSMGHEKCVPACWYLWRQPDRFGGILQAAGCLQPLGSSDLEFGNWLTTPHGDYNSNAISLLVAYVTSGLGPRNQGERVVGSTTRV